MPPTSDDKIELSKIVPSRFGDADVKTTTSLELAEIVRKMASLGAKLSADRRRYSKTPSGSEISPATWSSTPCPFPIGSISKPFSARTRPPSATTRSRGHREKTRDRAGWLFGIFGRDSDESTSDLGRQGHIQQARSRRFVEAPNAAQPTQTDQCSGRRNAMAREKSGRTAAARP